MNIHINIKIIITRLSVLVVFPIKAGDKDASSSKLPLELFRFKKRVKLSLKLLLFERVVVKRRSDRRSSSSFIVFSLSRRVTDFQVTDFPENVDTFCAENSDVKEGVHERRVSR